MRISATLWLKQLRRQIVCWLRDVEGLRELPSFRLWKAGAWCRRVTWMPRMAVWVRRMRSEQVEHRVPCAR
jgi:hypothetical protein